MRTVWQLLLDRLANGGPIEADEARRLDKKQWQEALGLGLLREIEMVESIICDQCGEGHWAGIHWVKPGVEAVFGCTEGVFEIEIDRLRQWRVDAVRVAGLTAGSLDLPAAIEMLLPDCLWRIGRRRLGGRYRDIFFGIGGDVPVASMSAAIRSSIGPGSALLLTIGTKVNPEGLPAGHYLLDLASISCVENERVVIDLGYVDERLTESAGASSKAVLSIPAPAGATWRDVSIIMFEESLQITISGRQVERTIADAGFRDRDQRLELLKIFAAARGTLGVEKMSSLLTGDTPAKKRVGRLRQVLQALVEIDGDTIKYSGKAETYSCEFGIRLSVDDGFRTPAGATWLDFTFHERTDGRIAVSVSEKQRFRGYGSSDSSGRSLGEVAEQGQSVTRIHSLEEMGLLNLRGQLTPEGTAFVKLLRGAGTLPSAGNNMIVVRMAEQLRTWTGITGDPVQLAQTSQRWTALFACSSAGGR